MEPGHDKMKEENHLQEQRKDSSVQIANPIYDVVFKFLLDDNKIARKFLSLLTGKKIVSLEYSPAHYSQHSGERHVHR